MSRFSPLSDVMANVTEKVAGTTKSADIPYVGLEHLVTDQPRIAGFLPASASISVNTVFRPGDTLFGKLRPNLRKVALADFDGYCSTDILVLRPINGNSSSFLSHQLRSRKVLDFAAGTAFGTKMPRTAWSMLKNLQVFTPPPSEQRHIAEILDALDNQISVSEQLVAKLESTKVGLVSSLFSDDWPMMRVGDLASVITSGSRGWARYYSDDGSKFIRIGNLTRAHINLRFDSLVHVRVPNGGEGNRTSLQADDLLISITADLGIIGVVPAEFGEAYINQHIALVRLSDAKVDSRWVGHYLNSPKGQAQFSRLNDQGAKAGLNLPTIADLRVPDAPPTERSRIVAVLDSVDMRIARAQREVQKLYKLKNGLVEDLLIDRAAVGSDVKS